jgi:hypothetical protein
VASLDALIVTSSGGGASSSASSAAPTELCVSVQPGQSSITRGKTATYTVQVSTKNGSAANVSVALTSQPSSQKPTFTSGCTKGDGTASCTVTSVTTTPVNLHAQIPVASNATSVTSVKLTATASIVSTVKWTPPAASGTTSVTSAAATPHPSTHSSKASSASATLPPLPLGPVPNLNAEASLLIGAGNAATLFPAIKPSAVPSASPADPAQPGKQNSDPLANADAVSSQAPVLTAQVAGLIALGLAIMLTVTRLSLRKRSGSDRPRS